MAELRGEALRQRGSYKHDIFVTSALGGRVSSNVIVRATKKTQRLKFSRLKITLYLRLITTSSWCSCASSTPGSSAITNQRGARRKRDDVMICRKCANISFSFYLSHKTKGRAINGINSYIDQQGHRKIIPLNTKNILQPKDFFDQ